LSFASHVRLSRNQQPSKIKTLTIQLPSLKQNSENNWTKAMQNWTRERLNRESEVLTMEIQKELFKGTGR